MHWAKFFVKSLWKRKDLALFGKVPNYKDFYCSKNKSFLYKYRFSYYGKTF